MSTAEMTFVATCLLIVCATICFCVDNWPKNGGGT